jgi:hypothetical protein
MNEKELREWKRLREEKAKWIRDREKTPQSRLEYAKYIASVAKAAKEIGAKIDKKKERELAGKNIDRSNTIRAVQNMSHKKFVSWESKADIPDNKNRKDKKDKRSTHK